jgi:DNA-binding NtrC family response regulator
MAAGADAMGKASSGGQVEGEGAGANGEAAFDMPVVPVRVGSTIADAERDLIIATLAYCDGAKERTADMLGISLKTLYNRLRAYGSE